MARRSRERAAALTGAAAGRQVTGRAVIPAPGCVGGSAVHGPSGKREGRNQRAARAHHYSGRGAPSRCGHGGAPLPREGGAAAGGRAAGRTTTPVGGRADGASSHDSQRGGAPLPAGGVRRRGHAGSAGGRREATRVRSPPGDRTTVKAAVRSTTSGGERRLTGRTTTKVGGRQSQETREGPTAPDPVGDTHASHSLIYAPVTEKSQHSNDNFNFNSRGETQQVQQEALQSSARRRTTPQ